MRHQAYDARRVLIRVLDKHYPSATLEERLRWAELLVSEFLSTVHSTPGYYVGDLPKGRDAFAVKHAHPTSPDGVYRLTLTDVGAVRLRLNKETGAIEMMPMKGTECTAAALFDVDANHIYGAEVDTDIVPRGGHRRPRKGAMQVLAELFVALVESPAAR